MKNAKILSVLINWNAVDLEQHLDKVESACKSNKRHFDFRSFCLNGLSHYEVRSGLKIRRKRDMNNIEISTVTQLFNNMAIYGARALKAPLNNPI